MMITSVRQEHQTRVKEIVNLSLRTLSKMYHQDALRFCHSIGSGRNSAGRKLPSFRYTAITLLGLHEARRTGLPVSFPLDEICTDLAIHASEEGDLGNKGLALWAALALQSIAADEALDAVLTHGGFFARAREGLIRSTELAWTVYALAKAWADTETRVGGLLRRSMKNIVRQQLDAGIQTLRSQRNGKTGLFQCATLPHAHGRFRDRMKTTSGFFDSQVYGAMALAQAGQALGRPDLLQEAHGTVRAILSHQGEYGEWPWHYDVRDGSIIDRYPIFSVHQDGMGPMVLLEVGEALGEDFQEPVERSLNWIFGRNEMHISMIDHELGVVWRALRRKGMRQHVLQASRVAHYYGMPRIASLLRAIPGRAIVYECRSYHLGWILYAFCRARTTPSRGYE